MEASNTTYLSNLGPTILEKVLGTFYISLIKSSMISPTMLAVSYLAVFFIPAIVITGKLTDGGRAMTVILLIVFPPSPLLMNSSGTRVAGLLGALWISAVTTIWFSGGGACISAATSTWFSAPRCLNTGAASIGLGEGLATGAATSNTVGKNQNISKHQEDINKGSWMSKLLC